MLTSEKRTAKITCLFLVSLFVMASFQVFPAGCSSDPNKDIASEFIQNALPIDVSKYELTLVSHASLYAPTVDCALKSEQSVLTVNCYFQNNALRGCNLYVKNGSIMYDKPYADLTDVATGFLEKYQTYSSRDSTEMINMLKGVDTANNSTTVLGNTKLTVITKVDRVTDYTSLSWTTCIEGTDYPMVKVNFDHGVFYGFSDLQGIYTIGDTTVNTSKEQAINTAMEYLKTYSYTAGGSSVSGFDVNESRTEATLTCGVKNSSVLYPMWSVILFLDHLYPGSVRSFIVSVWAKSGEVNHIGFYQEPRAPVEYYSYPETNDLIPPPITDNSNSSPLPKSPFQPLTTYLLISGFALAIGAIVAVALVKKRGKK
jgi:hypothetical protein